MSVGAHFLAGPLFFFAGEQGTFLHNVRRLDTIPSISFFPPSFSSFKVLPRQFN